MKPPLQSTAVRLAPGVPDLAALGASGADDFFADPPRVVTVSRARALGPVLRIPLPGTPDEHGRQHERARGAGTGYLLLQRWRGLGLDLARARLTEPRSTSIAARHWNLSCHLQAHGLATPRLAAMGERGGGPAARESFLIVRELEGFVPLSRWLAGTRDPRARRRGLDALGLALAALFRSRTWLPRTRLDNLLVSAVDEDCVALQLVHLQAEQSLLRERSLVRARRPTIAFTELARGRILARTSQARNLELLRALIAEAGDLATPRELLRVARAAIPERAARRAAVAQLG